MQLWSVLQFIGQKHIQGIHFHFVDNRELGCTLLIFIVQRYVLAYSVLYVLDTDYGNEIQNKSRQAGGKILGVGGRG